MRFFEIVLEQLDLAAELLHSRNPTQSRLALILVDNAAEYALHRYAVDWLARYPVPYQLPVLERKKLHKKRARVLGQHIKPKIAFARLQNAITADQATFIREAHEFRNQAYHAGRTHDSIITELATTYFSAFLRMLGGLAPGTIWIKSDHMLSPRVRQHLGDNIPLTISTENGIQSLVDSLERSLPVAPQTLSEACRATLEGWLIEIRYCIDSLVQDDDSVSSAAALIRDVQYWSCFWSNAPDEGFTLLDDGTGGAIVDPDQETEWKKLQEDMQGWRPRVSERTLRRWDARIDGLREPSKPGVLLQKYCKLVSEIEPFMKMLSHRCAAFDHYIEELLDDERDAKLRKRLEAEGS